MPYLIYQKETNWESVELSSNLVVEVDRAGVVRFGEDLKKDESEKKVLAGIRVLKDRDEIVIHQQARFYFSAQSFARVETFKPKGSERISCSICGNLVREGEQIVCCPRCQVIYHQKDDCPCWTSSQACATYGCGFATALNNQKIWIPEAF